MAIEQFSEKFASVASVQELALMIKHFRLEKCHSDECVRIQFSIADSLYTLAVDSRPEIFYSRLEIESATIIMLKDLGGKAKWGAAPQGHLGMMAQKLLDKTKTKGGGKGRRKK
eukprot:9371293-Pyramimonas_sp.AAC.1